MGTILGGKKPAQVPGGVEDRLPSQWEVQNLLRATTLQSNYQVTFLYRMGHGSDFHLLRDIDLASFTLRMTIHPLGQVLRAAATQKSLPIEHSPHFSHSTASLAVQGVKGD